MSKGKVAALLYDVPGDNGWHAVPGLAGIFHPDIPIPHHLAEAYTKKQQERVKRARVEWDRFEREMEKQGFRNAGRLPFVEPRNPLKLVWVSQAEAEAGQAAAAKVLAESLPNRAEE